VRDVRETDEANPLPAEEETHPTGTLAEELSGTGKQPILAAQSQPDCALCGAAGDLHHGDLRDRHFSAPGEWSLLACPRCGLVWLDPKPAPEDLDRLYRDYYTHEEGEGDSLIVRGIRRGIPAMRQGYRDRVPSASERALGSILSLVGPLRELAERGTLGLCASQRGELLDVGCGNGRYLEQMGELGWQVSGVERDARGAAVAGAQIGGDRVHADLEAAGRAQPEGYDVVTLSHVIEHLLDPIDTLAACRAVLKPGGLIVIATPNLASLGHRQFKRNWLHLDPPRHVFLFDPTTLATVVERAGFAKSRVTTPSSSAHFVWRASTEIASHGRMPELRLRHGSLVGVARSIGFWAYEYALTRMGRTCGEELLLTAENPR
jgi:2-polyprenyl-3-methyl-5-hydroxy-6-metoxy-1,4-benzoquinol methylase